jgi:hypothetical protein
MQKYLGHTACKCESRAQPKLLAAQDSQMSQIDNQHSGLRQTISSNAKECKLQWSTNS